MDGLIFWGFVVPPLVFIFLIIGVIALDASIQNPVLKDFCPDGLVMETEYGFLQVDKEEYFCEGHKFVCNFSEKQCYYLAGD